MKLVVRFFSVILVPVVMLASCNKNTPKDIATTWLTSFYHMDYEGAKKLSTEDTKNLLSLFEEFSAAKGDTIRANARKLTIKIKTVQQDGNKATVVYSVSDNPTKEEPLYLVKQNDKWLVQFSKQDQAAAAGANEPTSVEPAADSSSTAPADTTLPDTANRQQQN